MSRPSTRELLARSYRPSPDYGKVQALATLSLGETLREVAGQVANLSREIALASPDDPRNTPRVTVAGSLRVAGDCARRSRGQRPSTRSR